MTTTHPVANDTDTTGLLPPTTPGEVLSEEFLTPLGLTAYRLAAAIDVPRTRIGDILAGRRAISADTALRLARYFGNSERFWLELQTRYDLEVERDRLGSSLETIEPHGSV